MPERVAVTGVGAVSALGSSARSTFEELVRGTRGFGPVTLFDPLDARAKVAAEVRGLDVRSLAPAAEAGDFSRTDALALAAAREAFAHAGAPRLPFAVSLGGTTGGMLETEHLLLAGPLDRVDPSRASRLLSHPLDLTTDRLCRALGGAKQTSTLCAACSSSALALVQGAAWLAQGRVDLVLAGGADSLCRLTFFGFDALGALDLGPCRPFDRQRRGLSLGEGAAFLCLERESTARARGADILAFLSGSATGAEAHHITHPEPSGTRAAELLGRALRAAGLGAAEHD
jgi:3-oxoacyl-[acyl-carrier-protein] synthase II